MLTVSFFEDEKYYFKQQIGIEKHQKSWIYGKFGSELANEKITIDKARLFFSYILELKGKTKRKQRLGADLTFSAPKSVSIVGIVLQDKRVVEAHEDAVKQVLDYIENNYRLIRKQENKKKIKETGKLVVVGMNHVLSRDNDPQLHTHALLLNVAKDSKDKIVSIDYKDILDTQKQLGKFYRQKLAENLKVIGYEVEIIDKDDMLFEIKGIPKSVIQLFSERRRNIVEYENFLIEQHKNAGMTDKEIEKKKQYIDAIATFSTRKNKKNIKFEELLNYWNAKLGMLGYTIKDLEMTINQKNKQTYIEIEEESKRKLERLRQVLLELERREKEIEKKEMTIQQAEIELEKKKQEYYKMRDENKQKLKRLQEILLMIDNRENVLEDATILNNLIESAYEYNFQLNPKDLIGTLKKCITIFGKVK